MKNNSFFITLCFICIFSFQQLLSQNNGGGSAADFVIPDTICVNQFFSIANTSTNASTYYWNFCSGNINTTPIADNIGNPGSLMQYPVATQIFKDSGNYYMLVANNQPGTPNPIVRLNFGNSLSNTPTAVNLGNPNNALPDGYLCDLKIENENGHYYVIAVGGLSFGANGTTTASPRVVRLDFGNSLLNTPTGTNLGNLDNWGYPHSIDIFQSGSNYYGFVLDNTGNKVSRLDFGNSFANTPTTTTLPNIPNLNGPSRLSIISYQNNWYGYIANSAVTGNNSITILNFGNSLVNDPTATTATTSTSLNQPCSISVFPDCGGISGLIATYPENHLITLNFPNGPADTIVTSDMGNAANFDNANSINNGYRVADTLYVFIPNLYGNTLARLQYLSCNNSSIPSSTLQTPPAISYNTPGVYNIALATDETLITGSSVCKQVVVVNNCNLPSTADFIIPDTICVNQSFSITNTSTNANTYYWNFCSENTNATPIATNLGNPGNLLDLPVFTQIFKDSGNYYMLVTNNQPGTPNSLVRLNYGSSLSNVPAAINLGNPNNAFPDGYLLDLKIVNENGHYYGISIGGWANGINGTTTASPRLVRLDFGSSLMNTPTGTNLGNLGNWNYPQNLEIFQSAGNYYGFVLDVNGNSLSRLDFGNSISNTPTSTTLPNIQNLNYPTGISFINYQNNWYAYIVNVGIIGTNSITVLNFGNSLVNNPTATTMNTNTSLNQPCSISVFPGCGGDLTGLIGTYQQNHLVTLNFPNGPTGTVETSDLGNIANINHPGSINRYRVADTLYTFIPNSDGNTISRLEYLSCNNSSIPSSTLQTPPAISYNTPGVYNITLTTDETLITESSVCKQVVVINNCNPPSTADFVIPDTICVNQSFSIANTSTNASTYYWNFCSGNINTTPIADNIGNPGSLMQYPVATQIFKDSGNYYMLVANNQPGTPNSLVRLNFGNSLSNTPTAVNLGNPNNALPDGYLCDLKIENENGHYYVIAVGGLSFGANGTTTASPRVVRLDFGNSLLNTPTGANLGDLDNWGYPHSIDIFQSGSNYYGFVLDNTGNKVSRLDFGNSFSNTPITTTLPNIPNLNGPSRLSIINYQNNWYGYIANSAVTGNNSITILNFGNSLVNDPTATTATTSTSLNQPCSISVFPDCGGISGLVATYPENHLTTLNFPNGPTGTIVTSDMGNIANFDNANSINNGYRIADTLFVFIPNLYGNTMSRLKYLSCNNSSIPSSTLQTPPAISYNTPGVYNITLATDETLITESSVCKQVVVVQGHSLSVNSDTICSGESTTLTASGADSYSWSPSTGLSSTTGAVVTASPTVTTTYTVTGTGSCGNSTAISTVKVNALPSVKIITDCKKVKPGQCIDLKASVASKSKCNWNTGDKDDKIRICPNACLTYTLSTIDDNGCINHDTCTIFTDLDKNFCMFPNPNNCDNGKIRLGYSVQSHEKCTINVYSFHGDLMHSCELNEKDNHLDIDCEKFKSGVYFYTVSCNGKIVKQDKFMISK